MIMTTWFSWLLLALTLSVLAFRTEGYSETVNTGWAYSGTNLTCPSNQDCSITCNVADACRNGGIVCPNGYDCTITCVTTASCRDAKFYAKTANSLTVSLDRDNYDMVIYAPQNGDMELTMTNIYNDDWGYNFLRGTVHSYNTNITQYCDYGHSCYSAKWIEHETTSTDYNGGSLYLRCNDGSSCWGAYANYTTGWYFDGEIVVAESASAWMQVHCPSIIPSNKFLKNCNMYCNGYYSCAGHEYYAIRGYDDMSVTCETSDSCYGDMYCNDDFLTTCAFGSSSWPSYSCSSCPSRFTPSPTVVPTANPTDKPTNNPTDRPTGFPTDRPTNRPSSNPSMQPSLIPSVEPSNLPTNMPSDPTPSPSRTPTMVGETWEPSDSPSKVPSGMPSTQPTMSPTLGTKYIDFDIRVANASLSKSQLIGNDTIHMKIETIVKNTILTFIEQNSDETVSTTLISVDLRAIDDVLLNSSSIVIDGSWDSDFSYHVYVRVWYYGDDIGTILFELFESNQDLIDFGNDLVNTLDVVLGDSVELLLDCSSITAQSSDYNCRDGTTTGTPDGPTSTANGDTDIDGDGNTDNQDVLATATSIANNEQLNVFTLMLIGAGVIISALFGIASFHAKYPFKCCCINAVDDVQTWRLLPFAFQLWDVYSDVSVSYTYWLIFMAIPSSFYFYFAMVSTVCVLFPWIINIFYAVIFLPRKLSHHSKRWLVGRHDRWFLFLTLATGNVYTPILLCNSKILGMSSFDMGLSKWEVKALRNVCFLTVLFENIPQFGMNIIFFYFHGFSFNFILLSALISSFINILTFVFGAMTTALHQTPGIRFRLAVTIDKNTNAQCAEQDIRNIIENIGYRSRLSKKLALSLRCRTEQIEVPFIVAMQDGCEIECLYDPDEIVKTPADLEKLLTFQLSTLSLHNAIKDAFRLSKIPIDMKAVHLEFTQEYMNHLPSAVSSDKNVTYVEQVVSISKPDLLSSASMQSISSFNSSQYPNAMQQHIHNNNNNNNGNNLHPMHHNVAQSPLSLASHHSNVSDLDQDSVNLALPSDAAHTDFVNINMNQGYMQNTVMSTSVSREASPRVTHQIGTFNGSGARAVGEHAKPPPRRGLNGGKRPAPPMRKENQEKVNIGGEGGVVNIEVSKGNAVVPRNEFRLPSFGNGNHAKQNGYGNDNNDDSSNDNSDSEVLFSQFNGQKEGNDINSDNGDTKSGVSGLYTQGVTKNGKKKKQATTTKGRVGARWPPKK